MDENVEFHEFVDLRLGTTAASRYFVAEVADFVSKSF